MPKSYSDIFLQLAAVRGLNNIEEIEKANTFKYSKHIHAPESIAGMNEAVNMLYQNIKDKQRIAIYADYDCDGIPGATILSDFFDKIKYNNYQVYIPHRHNEGYGVHIAAIDKLLTDKVSLMITVDLGITNIKEIEYAVSKGMQVIVTDHHLPIRNAGLPLTGSKVTGLPLTPSSGGGTTQILPPAHIVINMKRDDCNYPDKNLCGCATAWKLIVAFLNKHRKEFNVEDGWEKTLLDLVGLSTIADMVPMKGENRALAYFGLKVLKISKRVGLLRILNNGQYKGHIDEETVGFTIGPRLNSASRMDDPNIAYQALYDKKNGYVYADRLEALNNNRKQDVKDSLYDIDQTQMTDNVILLTNADWNPGVLGLISSRLVEETSRTVFVAGGRDEDGNYKGSVRAGKNTDNVVQMMSEVTHLLLHFGGHEAAGGFKVHESKLEDFRRELNSRRTQALSKVTGPLPTSPSRGGATYLHVFTPLPCGEGLGERPEPTLCVVDSSSITRSLYDEIRLLGPFGIGNEAPRLCIKSPYKIGFFGKKKEHLELLFLNKNNNLRVIKFSFTENDKLKAEAGARPIITLAWDSYRDTVVGRLVEWR